MSQDRMPAFSDPCRQHFKRLRIPLPPSFYQYIFRCLLFVQTSSTANPVSIQITPHTLLFFNIPIIEPHIFKISILFLYKLVQYLTQTQINVKTSPLIKPLTPSLSTSLGRWVRKCQATKSQARYYLFYLLSVEHGFIFNLLRVLFSGIVDNYLESYRRGQSARDRSGIFVKMQ